MSKLLIIGAGMAAARLLQEFANYKHDYQIELVGEEPHAAYNRILLSALLAGDKTEQDLQLLDDNWYADHGIKLGTTEKIVDVDLVAKTALTNKQRKIHFDKVIFATGSIPWLPPIPGIDTGNVLAFRNIADLEQIRTCAADHKQAVVIGAGLLGLEAASGLARLGLNVTVVHRSAWIMNRQLDKDAADILQKELESQGIQFQLGSEPTLVQQENNTVRGLELANGHVLPCGMLMVTTGITPNSALAKAAGISCNKGILVNNKLACEQQNCFALGECCELNNTVFGLVAPVYEQARILVANLCAPVEHHYQYQESTTQLKIAGVNVVSSGQLPFPDDSESQILIDRTKGIYRRLVFSNNKLIGFLLVGDKSNNSWYTELVKTEQDINFSKSWMMFGNTQLTLEQTTRTI